MSDPGGVTQISGAVGLVPSVPDYDDETAETLGEDLAALYARREAGEDVDSTIDEVRRRLRRGPRLRAGEFLKDGRYRLLGRMGESPSETTWRAWDRDNQRTVVVKEMVGPWVSQKQRVGTFLEAARKVASLDHAGLATMQAASQNRDGFVYLVTNHFEAGRLDDFDGDAVDVMQAVIEVGDALTTAHEADLIHGRIQPRTIYFGADGGARLTDFDLAGELTNGESAGIYVAPEAAERGSRASAASDVYGLAMTAVYGLNGGQLSYRVVRDPRKVIDALPVAVEVQEVLARGVEWDTDERYASIADFVDALLTLPDLVELLAERAWERERSVVASEHYTRLWSLKPSESVRIKTRLAEIYLGMEAWDEALACLLGALGEAEETAVLYPLLRQYAEGTGDWKRVADALWDEAKSREPLERTRMRAELAELTESQLEDPSGASEIWTLVLQDHRLPLDGQRSLTALSRLAEEREDWESFVDYSQDLLPHLSGEEGARLEYSIGRAYLVHLEREDDGLAWIDRAEENGVVPLDLSARLQEVRARRGQWRRVIALMRLEAEHESDVHRATRALLRGATIARAVHLEEEAEQLYAYILDRAPQHYPALRELARMYHRSGRSDEAMEAYGTLVRNHYLGKSEEPEASERAADHTGFAILLLAADDWDGAVTQLEAALALQPDNVEALQLVGALYIDRGQIEDGARALEQLYALYKAVNTRGERLETALQRADAAWYRGRLVVAMRWYNVALDADPDRTDAWWGLAKIALSALGGHPGADRAPWLAHTPAESTPQELLARLFMGLFKGEALAEWIAVHPLGAAVAEAGATTPRLASAAVDLLGRYGLLVPAFFDRLREAYPDWQSRFDLVQAAFDGESAFLVNDTYHWSQGALTQDFEVELQRSVLPPGRPVRGRLVSDFGSDAHMAVLTSSPQPDETAPPPPEVPTPSADSMTPPVIELRLGESVEFRMDPDQVEARIGSAPESEFLLSDLETIHAVLQRVGTSVYVHRHENADMQVEGREVPGWRLLGGEALQLGSYLYDVVVGDGQVALAERRRAELPTPSDSDDEEATEVTLPARDSLSDAEVVQNIGQPGARSAFTPTSDALPMPDRDVPPEPMTDLPAEDAPTIPGAMIDDDEIATVVGQTPMLSLSSAPEGPAASDADEAEQEHSAGVEEEPVIDVAAEDEEEPVVDVGAEEEEEPVVDLGDEDEDEPPDETVRDVLNPFPEDLRTGEVIDEDSLGPAGEAPMPNWAPADASPDFDDDFDEAGQTAITDMRRPSPSEAPYAAPVFGMKGGEWEDVPDSEAFAMPTPDGDDANESTSEGFVEVMSGPARGTRVAVRGMVTLGRAEANDVCIAGDSMLADLHCKFTETDGVFKIVDNGTDRGTVVNGSRVSEAVLLGGETIMAGVTVFRFQLEE